MDDVIYFHGLDSMFFQFVTKESYYSKLRCKCFLTKQKSQLLYLNIFFMSTGQQSMHISTSNFDRNFRFDLHGTLNVKDENHIS